MARLQLSATWQVAPPGAQNDLHGLAAPLKQERCQARGSDLVR
jgi:hypothetical protein